MPPKRKPTADIAKSEVGEKEVQEKKMPARGKKATEKKSVEEVKIPVPKRKKKDKEADVLVEKASAEKETADKAESEVSEEEVQEKKKPTRGKKATEKKSVDEVKIPASRRKKKDKEANGLEEKASVQEEPDLEHEEAPAELKRGGRKKAAKDKHEEKEEKPAPVNSTNTKWDSINFTCTKKNSLGQNYNLKISCWNVGGLASCVKKQGLKFLDYEKPDIVCLQETKCSEEKLPDEIKELEGYKQYWCGSEKKGYAGVGILTKQEPLEVFFGIDVPELDEDGRCVTAEYEKYYVVCVYVPNAGRKLVTLQKRLDWNKCFKDYIKGLDKKKPVIICGDMNVAHNEIDLARPQSNTKNAGFTPEEREGMTDFLEDGFVDTYRKLYPDKPEVYTFWSYMANSRTKNVGWRLDYFIVSERIMDLVCDNVMRTDIVGSDHCPITLFINI